MFRVGSCVWICRRQLRGRRRWASWSSKRIGVRPAFSKAAMIEAKSADLPEPCGPMISPRHRLRRKRSSRLSMFDPPGKIKGNAPGRMRREPKRIFSGRILFAHLLLCIKPRPLVAIVEKTILYNVKRDQRSLLYMRGEFCGKIITGEISPRRNSFWPETSFPLRRKNARTRTHQRILTIWPS
jgi:hypothetical protein